MIPRWARPRSARSAVAIFLAIGVLHFLNTSTEASWSQRNPDLEQSLGISHGTLGLALLWQPVGLLFAFYAGRLVDRFGTGVMLLVGGAVYWIPLPLLGIVPSFEFLAATLLVVGLGNAVYDVAWGVQSTGFEQGKGRRFHLAVQAFTSAGLIWGVANGGWAAEHGVPISLHLGVLAVFALLVALAVVIWVLPNVRHERTNGAPDADDPTGAGAGTQSQVRSPVRHPFMWGLAAITGCGGFMLGSALTWGAPLLTDLKVPEGVTGASAALLAFSVTSAVAQLSGGMIPKELVSPWVLTVGGGLAGFVGSLLIVLRPGFSTAVIGFALIGVASSFSWPIAQSVASERFSGGSRGRAMAMVTLAMYFGIGARAIIGPIADASSLSTAMITITASALAIVGLAPIAMRGGREHVRPGSE